MVSQQLCQKALKFAAGKHQETQQTIPGTNLPYVVHLSNVAMEILIAASNTENFDLDFALQVALLHDTLEDTGTTYDELTDKFGVEIAEGVMSLTKYDDLPKTEKMPDTLRRIKQQRKEVWAVKLADRITNLQQPPSHWDGDKKQSYLDEALEILNTLQGRNRFLEDRLAKCIENYKTYL